MKCRVEWIAVGLLAAGGVVLSGCEGGRVDAGQREPVPFVDGVAFDTALSWISRPGRFDCPPAYSNESFRYVADLVASTGVRHVRERLRWRDVSPQPDVWKPGHYLDNANLFAARGIRISGMFHDCPDYTRGKDDLLPRDPMATFDFCRKLAETFGERMEIWEFWNEQDIAFTREPAWDYAAAFKAAALGFRAGGFKGTVAPGALCRDVRNEYAETYFANDVMDYADVMNFHVYSPPSGYPALFAALRAMMARYGAGDKAVIVTECGTNQEGDSAEPGVRREYKAHSRMQEAVQEEFAVKSQILMRMEGIARNYFFVFGAFNERGGAKDWGLMRRDGTCKPAVAAFRKLIEEVGDGTLAGEVSVPDGRVRAFRFDMPDGSRRIAYWSRSEIDDGTERVRAWRDEPESCALPLTDGGALPLTARRRVAYVRLSKGTDVTLARAAAPVGREGATDDPSFDSAIVLRLSPDPNGFVLGGNKGVVEMRGESLPLRLEVWNLDARPKSGRIAFEGTGEIDGLPESLTVSARGQTTLKLVYRVCSEPKASIAFGGTFGGRRISRLVAPVVSEASYRATCELRELAWRDVRRWHRNTSANRYDCEWDEKERAIRFRFGWDVNAPGTKDRWFFPRCELEASDLDFSRVEMLTYEVKSVQDKVENDYRSARVWLKDRKGALKDSLQSPPVSGWETRRLVMTDAMRANGVSALQFGGHPRGREVTYWIRNVRVYKRK